MKKIRIYVDGNYQYTTERYKTIKQATQTLREQKNIVVASIPNYNLTVSNNSKITGEYIR